MTSDSLIAHSSSIHFTWTFAPLDERRAAETTTTHLAGAQPRDDLQPIAVGAAGPDGAALRRVAGDDEGIRLIAFGPDAAFGTSVTGCACAVAVGDAASALRRNVTLTPMSGRIRGSSCHPSTPLGATRARRGSKPMRTSTVAFWRSAVGTVVMTLRRNLPVGIRVEDRA